MTLALTAAASSSKKQPSFLEVYLLDGADDHNDDMPCSLIE
jgi:hypothetical protein